MRPYFQVTGLRFRPLPILVIVVLGLLLPTAGGLVAGSAARYVPPEVIKEKPWVLMYVGHSVELVLALLGIVVMKRFIPGHYGLQWPPGKTYVAAAVGWGVFFGVLMTVVDHGPTIAARVAPSGPYALTAVNILGWLSFEGLFVGFPEEVVFRGLLVTYLMAKFPGRVVFFGYDMHVAGVVVALVFALAHVGNFWIRPFGIALGQQLYAFALGVLYAYWFEKSQSLVAPIIGHNLSDGVEYALVFLMVALCA